MMPNQPSQFVDISKFPADERPHIVDLALKHNALSEDVDKVSGFLPEEKRAMHAVFERIRVLLRYLLARRFSVSLFTLELGFIIFILEKLGINTRAFIPEVCELLRLLQMHVS